MPGRLNPIGIVQCISWSFHSPLVWLEVNAEERSQTTQSEQGVREERAGGRAGGQVSSTFYRPYFLLGKFKIGQAFLVSIGRCRHVNSQCCVVGQKKRTQQLLPWPRPRATFARKSQDYNQRVAGQPAPPAAHELPVNYEFIDDPCSMPTPQATMRPAVYPSGFWIIIAKWVPNRCLTFRQMLLLLGARSSSWPLMFMGLKPR